MKNILIVALSLVGLFMFSCSKPDREVVQQRYKLIEAYSDPGDGSGDFLPVQSSKMLEIIDDTIVQTVNGLLCNFSRELGQTERGIIDQVEMKIVSTNCSQFVFPYTIDGDYFILNCFSIEGCKEKYEKVE